MRAGSHRHARSHSRGKSTDERSSAPVDSIPSSFSVRTMSCAKDFDRACDSGASGGAQAVRVGAADEHGSRAEAQGLDDVARRAGCRRRAARRSGHRSPRPLRAGRGSSAPRHPAAARRGSTPRPPSAPSSTARRASSAVCTPLMTIGPFQASRIQRRSFQLTIDCSSAAPTSAYGIGPSGSTMLGNYIRPPSPRYATSQRGRARN